MGKYVVVYQDTFSVEIDADNLNEARTTANNLRAQSENRKLLSVEEHPLPFDEDRECPECVEALPELRKAALQLKNTNTLTKIRRNLDKLPNKGRPPEGPQVA